jgi:hypothetical protein
VADPSARFLSKLHIENFDARYVYYMVKCIFHPVMFSPRPSFDRPMGDSVD